MHIRIKKVWLDSYLAMNYDGVMDQDFATVVSECLDAYVMTEAEFAQLVGCSQPTIHQIKTGKVKNPRYTLGLRIMEAYRDRPRPTPKRRRKQ